MVMNSELAETYKNTIDEIDSKFEQKRKSIDSDIELSKQSVEELYENYKFSPNAIVDFDKILLDDENSYLLPYALRVGNLEYKHGKTAGVHIPAVLPFTNANAIAFMINQEQNNEEAIQQIFQLIAFRLMLSLPANLCKFHFVDTYSLGRKFNIMNQLSEKIMHNAIVSDEKKLGELITELEQAVIEINRNQLIKYQTLEEYNKQNSALTVPYRFVFISNFPHGFSKDLSDRFFQLIRNQNAIKAGIYIFYSIDNTVVAPYGFDLSVYMNVSTLVNPIGDGNYEIENSIFNKSFNDTFAVQLHTQLPHNLEVVISTISRKADNVKPTVISLDADIDKLIQTETYWEGNSRTGIKIPVGKKPIDETVFFELGGNSADYFAMVGGRPGYGKTVLLHNIIRNGAIIYSPKELQFWLIDCKDGVGFQVYKNLPHAKFISINNNLDLILNALQNLQGEMTRRANLFKEASEEYNSLIAKIEDYREVCNRVLPRIVLVIDEFQLLLSGGYRQANAAREILTDLIKRGRSAGINIIFCTQSYRNIDFDTNLITLRMAFSLESFDSEKILRNEAAAQLRLRGETILNKTGDKKDNVKFQCAFIDEKTALTKYVKFCNDEAIKQGIKGTVEGDGQKSSNLFDNEYLIRLLSSDTNDAVFKEKRVYLGIPYYIGNEHIYFNLSNRNASNVMIIGNDIQTAMSSILLINLQLMMQNSANSKFYIVDFLNTDHQFADYYADFAKSFDNIIHIPKGSLAQLTDEIEQELDRRIENDKNNVSNADEGKIVLTLSYIQVARELKKQGWDDSPVAKKLMKILKDGSEFGIHLMFYSYNLEGLLDDMFDGKIFDYFENRILLQGGKLMRHEEQNIKQGYGLIENKTHKLMPFMFYETFEGDASPEVQEVFDYVFSIYNKN
jgi:hypothetical protein